MCLPISLAPQSSWLPFRRTGAVLWLGMCLALGWAPTARAVTARSIATFPDHNFTNVVKGPDGSFFLFLTLPGSTLLRVSADGTTMAVYTGPTTYNPPRLRGPLLLASDGNFYGVVTDTYSTETAPFIYGAIFRLTPTGEFSFVHEFTPDETVGYPARGLVQGNDGALYGMGAYSSTNSHGMIFRCTLDGAVTNLYNFADGYGYAQALGRLTLGKDGNFYGATTTTIYRITPAGEFATLHTFPPAEAANLNPGFAQDADGNFYGTAAGNVFADDGGTVFRFTATGQVTILHSFPRSGRGTDGAEPKSPLVAAADGNFYGITSAGGTQYGGGTIFQVTPGGEVSVVYRAYGQGPQLPGDGLIADAGGDLYGTNETELVRIQTKSAGALTFNVDHFTTSPNAGSAFLTVSRNNGTAGAINVAYNTADDTAHAGIDYTATSGVLRWADGDNSIKNFRVPLTSHGEINGSGLKFTVQLSNPTGDAVLGGPASAEVDLSGSAGLFQTQAGMVPLYVFSRGLDGDMVQRVGIGSDGNFYGTTSTGGIGGDGNTFRLAPSGEMTLLAFNNFLEVGGLTPGTDGNFYGTAAPDNAPTSRLFRLAPGGIPTNLYDLGLSIPLPQAAAGRRTLLQTRDGQLYGTLQNTDHYPSPAIETVFRLNPDGTQTTLYTLSGGSDVYLTEGADGNLYAVVQQGGQHYAGFLFRLTPDGQFTRLYDFNTADGGAGGPVGPLVAGPDGALYGLTRLGGAHNAGTFFRLKLKAGKDTKPKVLHSFDPESEGPTPQNDLLLSADGNFYGTLATTILGSLPSTTFYRLSTTGELTVLYHNAPQDRPLSLLVQGSDRAFYFKTQDSDPSAILRFDPDAIGKTTVQIAEVETFSPLGPGKAVLRLSRSGDVSQALTVPYSVKGDALAGSDYKALPGQVRFQPGHFDATIKIKALPTITPERRLRLKLLSAPDGRYDLVPGRNKALFEFVPVGGSGG